MKNGMLLGCLVWFVSLTINAEVYKWTDKNGKVHYSDKAPDEQSEALKKVDVTNNTTVSNIELPDIKVNKPIKNNNINESKQVVLETVELDLENTDNIGLAYMFDKKYNRRNINADNEGLACVNPIKIKTAHINDIVKQVDFQTPFNELFDEYNYLNFNTKTKKRFALQKDANIDLSLAAIVTEIKVFHCGSENARNLNESTKNSTHLKIKWELFDNLQRKVIYSGVSEGVDSFFDKSPRYKGAIISLKSAFQQALNNLLSKQDFTQNLLLNKTETPTMVAKAEEINFEYGDAKLRFIDKVEKIKKGTATIRTVSGHGSGFVVSDLGYVITNSHVIEGSREFIVIVDGQEFTARLVRSDSKRDIALLKIDPTNKIHSINLASIPANLGETIFVIGTPLDEQLDFSISKGIISANRLIQGNSYYQTDAAVNPGNSGGPVFNEYGNVIGVTVAGFFTKDGGSKNINYIIPIADALSALGY